MKLHSGASVDVGLKVKGASPRQTHGFVASTSSDVCLNDEAAAAEEGAAGSFCHLESTFLQLSPPYSPLFASECMISSLSESQMFTVDLPHSADAALCLHGPN